MRDRKRQQNNSVEEAASTGAGKNADNSDAPNHHTDGMAPNAKDQLATAMKTPAIDGQKAIDLTFASFKKMSGKKSKENK